MQDQKKQLIILAVLVIGLIAYLAFTMIPRGISESNEALPPRLDPNSPMYRGEAQIEP